MLFESFPDWLMLPLAAIAAVLLDRCFGEVPRWHPLVGFGKVALRVEQIVRRFAGGPRAQRFAGLAAWLVVVLPLVGLAAVLRQGIGMTFVVDVVALYLALGARSLAEHVERVERDLAGGDLAAAREHVGWVVSRDTSTLDAGGVAKAAVETTLENGNDAVFGALFWFALLGAPGAVLFRLANTLDAMWGYKNDRFLYFGWAAARLDDVLNYVPARLTALTYAVQGRCCQALACWRTQAPAWESPNAGPVMSAGAGCLGLTLGGAAVYQGRRETRPVLGAGRPPVAADIGRALALVRRGVWGWLVVFTLVAVLGGVFGHA